MATEGEDRLLHRVKVLNLPRHENAAIKRLFQSYELGPFKKAPKWEYAFVNFESEAAAREAMKKLEGVEFKRKTLQAEYMPVSEDAYRKRFQQKTTASAAADEQQPRQDDTRSPAQRLADQVTPLHG